MPRHIFKKWNKWELKTVNELKKSKNHTSVDHLIHFCFFFSSTNFLAQLKCSICFTFTFNINLYSVKKTYFLFCKTKLVFQFLSKRNQIHLIQPSNYRLWSQCKTLFINWIWLFLSLNLPGYFIEEFLKWCILHWQECMEELLGYSTFET